MDTTIRRITKRPLRLITLTFALLLSIILSGCHPFVKYPSSSLFNKQAAAGTVGGAAVGAMIGDAAITSGAGAGAGIGALVGLGIGSYLHSETRWLKKLQRDGVHVVQIGDRVRIIIPSDDIFFLDTDTLIPQHKPILFDVVQFVKNYGQMPVTINAFSDNIGALTNKLDLTLDQAKSVGAFFWAHGVTFNKIRPIGFGPAYPIASNDRPSGTFYNRRIEVTFWVDVA